MPAHARRPIRSVLVAFAATAVLAGGTLASAQDYEGGLDRPRRARAMTPADLQPQELRFWSDGAFRKQLLASYIPATDIEPAVSEDDREQVQAILKLISDAEFDEAIQRIERRRSDRSTSIHDFLLGNIHFQNDRLDEAAAAYLEAVRKYPNYRRAWKNLGLIRVKQRDFASALPALAKVIELGGGDSTSFGLLGFAHGSVDDFIAAESAYRMAILLDGSNIDWKMGLARSLFMQQRYADASALVGRLIERTPTDAKLWALQANAFIGLGQPLRAAENYEMIDRLGASTVETLSMLGDIYVNQGLFATAVDTYERAMEMDLESRPDRAIRAARVMVGRGADAETKELVEIIEELHGSTLEDEERTELLRLRARLAVAAGAEAEQVAILEEIIRVNPLDGDAYLRLGRYHRDKDETERAMFLFGRAENIPGFRADALVLQAQVHASQQEYAPAIRMLKEAQALRPRDSVASLLEQIEERQRRG